MSGLDKKHAKEKTSITKDEMRINKEIIRGLKEIDNKLTMLIIIELGKLGLNSKDIAKILNIADSTVRGIFPLSKIKVKKTEEK